MDTFEAKTHILSLLDKVETGEDVVIARRGKAVARSVREATVADEELGEAIRRLKDMRKFSTLGGLSWMALHEDDRR